MQYLKVTIESVLSQAFSADEMQIEVIDDGSTDGDVEGMVMELGGGRIGYYRQAQNVGSLKNFETCINRSRGHYIHILHGDDKLRPGFFKEITQLFKLYPNAGAAFSRFTYIDEKGKKMFDHPAEQQEQGILSDWLVKISTKNRIQYAAIVVKREVYETLGSFYGLNYGEDWVMWVRIAQRYDVAYSPQILAEYRKHNTSITGNKFISGEYVDDLITAMNMIQGFLPEEKRKAVLKSSKHFYSFYALKTAKNILHFSNDKWSALTSLKKALKLNIDLKLCWNIAKVCKQMLLKR